VAPQRSLFFVGGTPPNLGVVVQDHVQQGIMNFQVAIVIDEAQLAEFVHEGIYL
jgi:hypothetical protein